MLVELCLGLVVEVAGVWALNGLVGYQRHVHRRALFSTSRLQGARILSRINVPSARASRILNIVGPAAPSERSPRVSRARVGSRRCGHLGAPPGTDEVTPAVGYLDTEGSKSRFREEGGKVKAATGGWAWLILL